MNSIFDQVMNQIGGDQMKKIGSSLGVDADKTEAATGTAISALPGGLSRNAASPEGAAGKLLATVAPLVVGALGKKQRDEGVDPRGLANMLNGEREDLERRRPETA